MKPLLLFLALLLPFTALSADIPGTVVFNPITLGNDGAVTGITNKHIGDSVEMKGTPKTVTSILARNAIPAARRSEGMLAYVTTNEVTYILAGGIDNADWAVFASGPTSIVGTNRFYETGEPTHYMDAGGSNAFSVTFDGGATSNSWLDFGGNLFLYASATIGGDAIFPTRVGQGAQQWAFSDDSGVLTFTTSLPADARIVSSPSTLTFANSNLTVIGGGLVIGLTNTPPGGSPWLSLSTTQGTAPFNIGVTGSEFDGVFDDVLTWGFNVKPGQTRINTNIPAIFFSLESDYFTTARHYFEWNFDYIGTNESRRLIAFGMDRDNPDYNTYWAFGIKGFGEFIILDASNRVSLFKVDAVGTTTTASNAIIAGKVAIGEASVTDSLSIASLWGVTGGQTAWGISKAQGLLSFDTGKAIVGGQAGNDLELRAANSTAMKILQNGNVGIGQLLPEYPLQIADGFAASGGNVLWGQDVGTASPSFEGVLSWDAGKVTIGANTPATDVALITDGNVTRATILANGNVGVGTTNPATLFQVGDGIQFTGNTMAWGASGGDYGYLSWDVGRALVGAQAGKFLSFGANTVNDLMVVLGNGNVGIGTTNPVAKLQIDGVTASTLVAINTNQFALTNAKVGVGTAQPLSKLQVSGDFLYAQNNATDADNAFGSPATVALSLVDNGAQAQARGGAIGFGGRPGSGASEYLWAVIKGGKANSTTDNYAGNLDFWTTASTSENFRRMRIASTGNVGIGTDTTTSGRLVVDGGHITMGTDNTYDFGASGANRVRTGYFGTSVVAPTADIRTNIAQFDLAIADFVIGTRYTNSTRRSFVAASFQLAAAVAGTAAVTFNVEQSGVTNKLTISSGPLTGLTTIEPLTLMVGPGAFYYFADTSSGAGAVASIVAGTSSKTDW